MWDEESTARAIAEETADSAEAAARPTALPPVPGAVLLMEAEHRHCRWPLWEGEKDARFVCGSPRHSAATSYCREHWIASGGARANRPPSTRFLGREPKAVARQRLDLLTLRRSEGI